MNSLPFAPFNDLYTCLTLSRPEDSAEWEYEQLFDSETAFWFDRDAYTQRPTISLWHKHCEGPRLVSLRRKIRSWLGTNGHAISDELVSVVLAFSVALHEDYGSPASFFSEVSKLLVTADVKHTAIVPDCDQAFEGRFSTAGFVYGPLDGAKLAYRCKKAGSDHFSSVAVSLSRKPAIESPDYRRELIDLPTLCWRKKGTPVVKVLRNLLEQYFQEITKVHINMMWGDLDDTMLVPVALRSGAISIRQLEDIPGLCYISTYRNFGVEHSHGHVGMQHVQKQAALPKPAFVGRVYGEFEDTYKFSDLSSAPFHKLVQGIARSISRSWSHACEGRFDEAFLFMIIALEQVFSECHGTTQAVVSRTAVVTYQELEKPFDEALKSLQRLYDKRSRLVHDAVSVEYADFETAHSATKCVLETLLRFSRDRQKTSNDDAPSVHRDWLKKLDFIRAAIDAGETVEGYLLSQCGIAK